MLDAPNLYPKLLPCKFPHRHHQVWSTTSWQGASGLCFGGGVRPLGYPVGGGGSLGWEVVPELGAVPCQSQDVPNSKDIGSRKPGIIPARFGRIILEYVLHTGVI